MRITNRLAIILALHKKSIKDVIDNTDLSRNTVSNIVSNPNSNISIHTLEELCNYLKIMPNDFFYVELSKQDEKNKVILNGHIYVMES